MLVGFRPVFFPFLDSDDDRRQLTMKGSCTFVASVLAASTAALSSSSGEHDISFTSYCSEEGASSQSTSAALSKNGTTTGQRDKKKEKFAPRFDGLRFIETLVTAHR